MEVYTCGPSYFGSGGQFKASLGIVKARYYLENKLKAKGLGVWFEW
jgi:hypothetical protein